jgi:AraC-like DNA-binding protein
MNVRNNLNHFRALVESNPAWSKTEIAQVLGCSRDTVHRILKLVREHGWISTMPIRKKRKTYSANSTIQKQIIDLAIAHPEYGHRRIKKLLPETVAEDFIKTTLKNYSLSTVADRLVARYILKNGNAFLIPDAKWGRKYKVDKIITPDKLTPKDLAKVLGNIVPSARRRVPIIYPTCILCLSFRVLYDLVPGKNALEVIIRDIFSSYRTVELHELMPDATAKQYDRILSQTIYKHIFSACDICRLLFIVDHSNLFPDASTKYRILNNSAFKISYPLLQQRLYQIRENALAIICPNDLPVSVKLKDTLFQLIAL